MSLIEWRDEFSTGVPSIDFEHRKLIDLINELHANLAHEGSGLTVNDFLAEICVGISAHFALEEKIMREKKYDQYLDHKADHERLLDEIRDIMNSQEYDARFREEELSRRLKDWFGEHFRNMDARFHDRLG